MTDYTETFYSLIKHFQLSAGKRMRKIYQNVKTALLNKKSYLCWILLLMALEDSSPPTASASHVCNEPAIDVKTCTHTHTHTLLWSVVHALLARRCVCSRDDLIFGELPPQAADVLGGFWDLRLQTGGVSHLRALLVHPLHLLQRLAEGETGYRLETWALVTETFPPQTEGVEGGFRS